MHIAEGFLPPLHAAAWAVASAPFVVHGAREVRRLVRDEPGTRLLLGAAGAFTFVLSAIKLPSITGSSSHATGTGVGAIILRPPVMAVLGTVVLLFQALMLAHGGLTTLGANAFAMAIAGPWVGYSLFRWLTLVPLAVRVFISAAGANVATYVVTATQLALAFPQGGVLAAWGRFLTVFAFTQIPLAIVEGVIAILLINALLAWAGPELDRLGFLDRSSGRAAAEDPAGVARDA